MFWKALERSWILFYKWRYEWTVSSIICDQITGIIAEKILNVFHFTECNRIYPPIYTVFNICNPVTVPLFLCRNGKNSVLPAFVILGIQIECPVYLYYNIAKYLQRAAYFITRDFTFLCVYHGNIDITAVHVLFFVVVFFHKTVSWQSSRSVTLPLHEAKTP